jgi:hypothetical protein
VSGGGLVPAARNPHDSGMTMYQNTMAAARATGSPAAKGRGPGGETPVFDKLVSEYQDGFRAVPGEVWAPHPAPRFAELGNFGDRLQLPPGSLGR